MLRYRPGPQRRGYVYLMKKDEVATISAVMHIDATITDRRIHVKPTKRAKKSYWGWMMFSRPLHLWDAMEAGLIPLFNNYRDDSP